MNRILSKTSLGVGGTRKLTLLISEVVDMKGEWDATLSARFDFSTTFMIESGANTDLGLICPKLGGAGTDVPSPESRNSETDLATAVFSRVFVSTAILQSIVCCCQLALPRRSTSRQSALGN
jgi:hypothetical protein